MAARGRRFVSSRPRPNEMGCQREVARIPLNGGNMDVKLIRQSQNGYFGSVGYPPSARTYVAEAAAAAALARSFASADDSRVIEWEEKQVSLVAIQMEERRHVRLAAELGGVEGGVSMDSIKDSLFLQKYQQPMRPAVWVQTQQQLLAFSTCCSPSLTSELNSRIDPAHFDLWSPCATGGSGSNGLMAYSLKRHYRRAPDSTDGPPQSTDWGSYWLWFIRRASVMYGPALKWT